MKIVLKEAYQGWAAPELGRLPGERIAAGEHDLLKPLAEYLIDLGVARAVKIKMAKTAKPKEKK